jgi:hypothetical protein
LQPNAIIHSTCRCNMVLIARSTMVQSAANAPALVAARPASLQHFGARPMASRPGHPLPQRALRASAHGARLPCRTRTIAQASGDKQQEQRHEQERQQQHELQRAVAASGGASTALSPLAAPGGDIEGPSTDLSVIVGRLSKVRTTSIAGAATQAQVVASRPGDRVSCAGRASCSC